jgi:hypothetical protein
MRLTIPADREAPELQVRNPGDPHILVIGQLDENGFYDIISVTREQLEMILDETRPARSS